MSLLPILIALIIIGVLFYFGKQIIALIPMDGWIKQVAQLVLLFIVVVMVLKEVLLPLLGSAVNLHM